MTYLWPLIIGTLILQETASTGAVFVLALQSNLSLWPIHIIWALATLFDMYAGFVLGTLMRRRWSEFALIEWLEKAMKKLKKMFGGKGDAISLGLLGIIDFPYLNTFLAAWIGLPKRVAFLSTFAGNLIWYVLVWGAVLGLHNLISNPAIIVFIIIVVGILSEIVFRSLKKRYG